MIKKLLLSLLLATSAQAQEPEFVNLGTVGDYSVSIDITTMKIIGDVSHMQLLINSSKSSKGDAIAMYSDIIFSCLDKTALVKESHTFDKSGAILDHITKPELVIWVPNNNSVIDFVMTKLCYKPVGTI